MKIKLHQMADDTLCYASDKKSIKLLLNKSNEFEQISGLKWNKDKCDLTYVGRLKMKENR